MKYLAVVFDLDGVIVDTEPVSRDGWRYAFKKMGLEFEDRVFFKLIGLTSEKIKDIFKQEYGREFSYKQARGLRHEYIHEYVKKNGIGIKPGIFELLDFLGEHGICCAVATSTSREYARRKMIRAGIKDRFDTVVCGDEIENGKPAPDIFLEASDNLGVEPEKCLVIEDSENGVRAAYAAGMDVIMVPDLREPDEKIRQMVWKVLPSLYDVIPFLQQENHS